MLRAICVVGLFEKLGIANIAVHVTVCTARKHIQRHHTHA